MYDSYAMLKNSKTPSDVALSQHSSNKKVSNCVLKNQLLFMENVNHRPKSVSLGAIFKTLLLFHFSHANKIFIIEKLRGK